MGEWWDIGKLMIKIKQLEVGGFDSNYSYLIHDEKSGDAALVDPCGNVQLINDAVGECSNINPKYILLTHGHGDHTSGVCEVRRFFNAPIAGHPNCSYKTDIQVSDGKKLDFGSIFIECIHTPGHTKDSIVYHLSDDTAIFTGDTLFIDWCGYCDAQIMFDTMRNKVFPLADSNEVYSGHNYGRVPHAPLGKEKQRNPYLGLTDFAAFKEALKNL